MTVPLGLTMPVDDGLTVPDLVGLAETAERSGFHSVWVGEVAGPDPFTLLGVLAARTSRIRLGTGIAGIYPRSPALAAMGYATLASAAPGRVLAGLGASSPLVVGAWHGRDYDAPLATMRGYVAALRAAWSGERVHVDRPHVDGFRLTLPTPQPPPVVIGAMNPGMLRLAGEIADGVLLTWSPPAELAARIELVREGERAAGRAPGTVWAAVSYWGYAGDRPDDAFARMRRFVLQYAMVPTHRPSFVGSFDTLDEAARRWSAGDRHGALGLVPDAAVHRMCAVGDGAAVAQRAAEFAEAGAGLAIILTSGAAGGDVAGPEQTITRTAAAAGLRAGTGHGGRP